MDHQGQPRAPYAVPRYRAAGEPAWYHVLHGTVPGHQIDFIYCPEVPQAALTQTHLAHVARLIKYIEPRDDTSFAFAIGNLSRDDIQFEPGHGGLALIFGLRVAGVVDHASRAMPPYAHGLVAVDRSLDYGILLDTIFAFYRRFFEDAPTDAAGSFYRAYVRTVEEAPSEVEAFLREYTDGFTDLPRSRRSQLGCDFFATEQTKLHRITIVHGADEPFSSVAEVAATLGSILYRSDVKWTSISNGREVDIPGGVSVRVVPEQDAPRDAKGPVFRLDELPKDEAEIAEKLFGARPKSAVAPRMGWREQAAAKREGVRAKQITLGPGKGLSAPVPPGGAADAGSAGPAAAGALPVKEPVAAAAAALATALEPEAQEVDDSAPTRSAGLEADPAVDVPLEDDATTLNAGLAAEPLPATVVDAVMPTLVESPASPPPVAATSEPAKVLKPAPASDPGRLAAPKSLPPPPLDGRASTPDDAASLDAHPPAKPGKGRWLILAGALAAIVVGIVVVGSQSGTGGGPAAGTSTAAETKSILSSTVSLQSTTAAASSGNSTAVEPTPTTAPSSAPQASSSALSPGSSQATSSRVPWEAGTSLPSPAPPSSGSVTKSAAPTSATAKTKPGKGPKKGGVLDDDDLNK